jgi:hypothetical protein
MVTTTLFRVLKVIVTLALIGLLPAGCGDPCRNCRNIACPGSDLDCSRNDRECSDTKHSNKAGCELNKAECEAKKKETIIECEKLKSLCFKSCGAGGPGD